MIKGILNTQAMKTIISHSILLEGAFRVNASFGGIAATAIECQVWGMETPYITGRENLVSLLSRWFGLSMNNFIRRLESEYGNNNL